MAVWNVIEHDELTSAAATWTSGTFSTAYDHLCIVMSARSSTNNYTGMMWQFGGDTGANYSMSDIQTSSSSVSYYRIVGGTSIGYPPFSGGNSTASTFGSTVVWIPHYANTSNYKSIIFRSHAENATTTDSHWRTVITGGLWSNTSAVTSFSVDTNGTVDFDEYSSYTVYGINAA